MQPFTTFQSRLVPLPAENVDTDQVIPARFLKTTDRNGLGDNLFADWRYDADGRPRAEFVLNQPGIAGAQILLAGDNFGCGSSREHAPWALTGYGFRAVISTSFADIFRANSLKNGLLPIVVAAVIHRALFALVAADPNAQVTVDLAEQVLRLPGGAEVRFPIDAFDRNCLLQGVDELGYLLDHRSVIDAYEATRTARTGTALSPSRRPV